MVTEACDFRYLLIENYRKLKISEEQLATLFVIDQLISQGNPFITADLLSLKMTLDVENIDRVLAELLTKGFIEYITKNKKTVTSLEPLKKKLYKEFKLSLNKEETLSDSSLSSELESLYSEFQSLLGRSLSPVEISRIREWVAVGYSENKIIDALKDCINKGKKSLRSVDKTLLTWAARDDIQSEGFTSINNDGWDKNLEETIKIAKTPWLDDEN